MAVSAIASGVETGDSCFLAQRTVIAGRRLPNRPASQLQPPRNEEAVLPKRRIAGLGGFVFHVLNRATRGVTLFQSASDYEAFERVLCEALVRVPMRILCYALMPNHWHLVLWPFEVQNLRAFMYWLSKTHAERWQLSRCSRGSGAVYQGRYRAIPIQHDRHLYIVCRYVERNPSRAGLVEFATEWRWSSAWEGPSPTQRPQLSPWPIARPADWIDVVNERDGSEHRRQIAALRAAIERGSPFGTEGWERRLGSAMGMPNGWRGRGRPVSSNGRGKN
jgi:putative transposase